MLSLYLLRHGETEFSLQDRFCGAIDAELTDAGRRMTEAFADRYGAGPLRWSAIYTSTRRRTIATAAPLAAMAGVAAEVDPDLDEMSFGDWQGRAKSEIAALDPARFRRWLQDPSTGAPSGESIADVAARATAVVERIERRHGGGNVLLVAHKTILRVLTCALLGLDLRRYRDWIKAPVCSLTVIDRGPSEHRLRLLDDVDHLPLWLRDRSLHTRHPAAPALDREREREHNHERDEERNGDDAYAGGAIESAATGA